MSFCKSLRVASCMNPAGPSRADLTAVCAIQNSKALVTNFAGQWLLLRELKSAAPDTRDFDANLRRAMGRETEMFFESIIREDRSIRDLLNADLHVCG